jgi:hypothetical protein
MRGRVYIELMRAHSPGPIWLPLLAATVLAWPHAAGAQAFSADYYLSRTEFSGAGLSLAAGRNWFAQVAVGRSLQQANGLPGSMPNEAMRIGGGYRWSDGQSLSLHVTGGRGPERLGLSVSYDWPRYFVRLTYDSILNPVPQDRLRLSAGVRF